MAIFYIYFNLCNDVSLGMRSETSLSLCVLNYRTGELSLK
jgi:hypothetical protein